MISALRQSVGETPIPHLSKCSVENFAVGCVSLLEGDTPEIRKNFLFNLLYHFFCWNDIGTFLRIDLIFLDENDVQSIIASLHFS